MEHTEVLTRYTANFVDELAKSGVTDVVISPGSRSTPLSMTMVQHPQIKEWILVDERSAAFFALGLAKESEKTVALVCTSGTAAANYFPAIVEAHYSRVPLLILTADRPHELRDIGAPQAIDQIKMFGGYVKWFHEMALPEASDAMFHYVRRNASRAVQTANQGVCGPVHLNFPFREPLVPDFNLENIWGEELEENRPFTPFYDGIKQLTSEQIEEIKNLLQHHKKGLFVVGPQTNKQLAQVIVTLATKWQIPILADPLSQLRTGEHNKGNIVETYDAFLRDNAIRKSLTPDFIIRFGAMPISKAFLFYMKENAHIPQFVVEPFVGIREPVGNSTNMVHVDPVLFCKQVEKHVPHQSRSEWLETWIKMNDIARYHLVNEEDMKLTEGNATRILLEQVPEESTLFIGNSMAIRDVDTFLMVSEKRFSLLANRGANGIDGVVSSSVGAGATRRRVTLLIGDLSFYHDMNGLLAAKQYHLDVTIVLMNNNGGGIFSYLPQSETANKKQFELLFGTPLHLDFKHTAALYEANYSVPKSIESFKAALHQSYQERGLSIIEVKSDRTENKEWHRNKWQQIQSEILQMRCE